MRKKLNLLFGVLVSLAMAYPFYVFYTEPEKVKARCESYNELIGIEQTKAQAKQDGLNVSQVSDIQLLLTGKDMGRSSCIVKTESEKLEATFVYLP